MKICFVGVIIIVAACSSSIEEQPKKPTSMNDIDTTRGTPEVLAKIRLRLLRNEPLDGASDEPVLMIMDMPDGVVSVFAANDGSASLYYNKSGGAIIGHDDTPAIDAAAIRLLSEATKHIPTMAPVSDFPLPGPDVVRFYVRTPRHVYMAEAGLSDLIHDRVALSSLFGAGMDVLLPLSKLRDEMLTDNRRDNREE
jgi:hypothetical protein